MTVAATAGDQVAQHRGWFIFLALLLIIAGAAAIAFPVLSTFAVEFWAAIAFVIAGVAQTIHSFAARSWGGFLWISWLACCISRRAWCCGSTNRRRGHPDSVPCCGAGRGRSVPLSPAFQIRPRVAGSGCSSAASSASCLG